MEAVLAELGVALKPAVYRMNVKPLLWEAMEAVLGGGGNGLADMIIRHTPSAKDAAANKVERTYTGPLVGTRYALAMFILMYPFTSLSVACPQQTTAADSKVERTCTGPLEGTRYALRVPV